MAGPPWGGPSLPITCIIGERQPEAARRGPQAARAIRPLPIEQPVTEAAGRAPPWPEGRYMSRGTTWGHRLYNGCVLIYSNGSINQACRLIPPPYICTRGMCEDKSDSSTIRPIRHGSGPLMGGGVSWVYSHSHSGVTDRAAISQRRNGWGGRRAERSSSVGTAALLIDDGRTGHRVRRLAAGQRAAEATPHRAGGGPRST